MALPVRQLGACTTAGESAGGGPRCQKEAIMRRIVALVLVGVFVAPPVSAGQAPGKPIAWEKAQRLKGGTEIMLTVTGGLPTKVRFLFADDTMLLTLNPARGNLSSQVERMLDGIGAQWPA